MEESAPEERVEVADAQPPARVAPLDPALRDSGVRRFAGAGVAAPVGLETQARARLPERDREVQLVVEVLPVRGRDTRPVAGARREQVRDVDAVRGQRAAGAEDGEQRTRETTGHGPGSSARIARSIPGPSPGRYPTRTC